MSALPLSQPVPIFMLVLGIILLVPLIFGRLKIPNIVGLILAGVIVGPYGFNLLDRDASFQIFGQVGILYLMFLAAVEIDMYDLKKNFRKGLGFGLITFIIPMGIGILSAYWLFDVSLTTAVLLASMYASHTLVSYPLVSKFGLTSAPGAVIAVCGTIVAVLFALLALAEVVAVSSSGVFDWGRLGILLVLMVCYAVGVGWGFPVVTRYFFRKISNPVSQFIFVLAMVFLASLLAQVIGLESILGAFYAGLVMNRFIPRRSALMNHIDFVGNAIFIPYFLIGVGMLINVHVVFKGWGVLWAASIMVGTALGSKWIAAWLTQKVYRLTKYDRQLMFGLSSGKAAATIAATMIGFQYNLLSEDLMNGAVVMILICCIVASITTERSALRIRLEKSAAEIESEGIESTGFARQVVAVANPFTAEGLMRLAAFMRNVRNTDPITTLFVRNNDDPKVIRMGREALKNAASAALGMDIHVNEVERYDLNVVAGIINVMKERRATDIIIGLHRKSTIVDTFYGHMIESLVKGTDKMIIISRCFIPIDTAKRLVVLVSRNAQYETGFHAWLARICNLGVQLGCKIIFMCYPETSALIESVIEEDGFGVSRIYQEMSSWDDFILLSAQIGPDDILFIIQARRGSLSYDSDFEQMPQFLSKNFAGQNLVVLYPEQYGG